MVALSIVVVAWNMPRALPRTIRSLSPAMQIGIDGGDYEIVIVDNGSTRRFDKEQCTRWGGRVRFLDVAAPTVSPCSAANLGLKAAEGDLIGVLIDGARLASPGLVAHALRASQLHRRAVVTTLAFHLGYAAQVQNILNGYDESVEDRLLESADWTGNGYRLFGVSRFAASSAAGWFGPISESNAVFMRRELWQELGGYDEGFVTPGGGYCNLDTYARACELTDSPLVRLLGEGTFHQVHGGIATNSLNGPNPEWPQEYARLRGHPWRNPTKPPLLIGTLAPAALGSVEVSAKLEQVRQEQIALAAHGQWRTLSI